MKFYHPLLDFCRLQGSTQTLIGWIPPTPSQVSSLSAPSLPDVTNRVSDSIAPRPQVFSTSRQRLRPQQLDKFIPPYRHSQGHDLQSFTLKRSSTVSSRSCSFVVAFPSWISSENHWQLPLPDRIDLHQTRSWRFPAPCCEQLVPILVFSQTLKLCSRFSAFPTASGFIPSLR